MSIITKPFLFNNYQDFIEIFSEEKAAKLNLIKAVKYFINLFKYINILSCYIEYIISFDLDRSDFDSHCDGFINFVYPQSVLKQVASGSVYETNPTTSDTKPPLI